MLAEQARPGCLAVGVRWTQNLERDLDARGFIARAPDLGLTASPHFLEQGVAGGRRSSMVSRVSLGHGLTGVPGSGFSAATLTGAFASAEFGALTGVAVVAGVVPEPAGVAAAPP